MAVQMLPRRPAILAVFGGVVIFLFILFEARPSTFQLAGPGFLSSNLINDIYNITFGFEKIFVVGLPSRTDRRDAFILSAALSHIEIEFVDGVIGETVINAAIPSLDDTFRRPGNTSIGSWRAHLNAIQEIVRRNLTSALIFEDDADWDVRIKDQLHDFALSSQALLQPLSNSPSSYTDPTYPTPKDPSEKPAEILFDRLPSTLPPKTSPYGDNWDVLWLGHCGMKFARIPGKDIPKGRVVREDHTVPQRQYLETVANPDELKNQYPDHTRVVHHAQEGICSLVYAVSQAGARRILYELGIHNKFTAYDLALRHFCDGVEGKRYHNCLTVRPSLFHHHRPIGPKSAESDIQPHGDGFRKTAKTPVIRYSTRMNWETLLDGRTDYVDQWPDK